MAGATNMMPLTASRARKFAVLALAASALAAPSAAFATCTLSGTAVTCDGASAAYTYTGSSAAQVTVNSGATVTAPLVVAVSGSTLTNTGSITNTAIQYGVQYGDNATITNNGTITSTGSSTGAGAINVGANSTVTNNSVLTAYAGTPAVNFGVNGRFVNNTAATAAVSGNIAFGVNTGSNIGRFENYNLTYGFTGVVTGSGNLSVINSGTFTGTISQLPVAGSNAVSITNNTGGIFSGVISTGDTTTLSNSGTMYLYAGSTLGYYYTAGGTSLLSNAGSLTIGTASAPALLNVAGNFAQTSAGTLNIAIAPAGTAATAPGYNYSQIATTGTATLGGTLNLNVAAGFYPTGSVYKVIDAKGGISGNFSSVTGADLLFVSFINNGIVASGTGQAYQFTALHKSYATVLGQNSATPNQLAVAGGLDKLLTYANTNTGTDAASLLGQVDILDINQAKGFLDQLSPAGYLAYAQALHDQANTFSRLIGLRMNDQNSDHPEDGWWLTPSYQSSFTSVTGTARTKQSLLGFSGGYDFSGPRHVFGAALNLSWNTLKNGNATLTGTNRDYGIALYGAQSFGPIRLSGQVAYHSGKASVTRAMQLGNYYRTSTGSGTENLLKATAQVGFNLTAKGFTLQPFVGVDYAKGKISSFTETGGGAANLTVSSINADRTDLIAGVSFTRSKGKWRPYTTVTYRNLQSGGDNTVTAYLNGDSSTAFTVAGLAKLKTEVDVNAGMNIVFDDAGSLFFGYQGTYRSNFKAHGINLGIRLEF